MDAENAAPAPGACGVDLDDRFRRGFGGRRDPGGIPPCLAPVRRAFRPFADSTCGQRQTEEANQREAEKCDAFEESPAACHQDEMGRGAGVCKTGPGDTGTGLAFHAVYSAGVAGRGRIAEGVEGLFPAGRCIRQMPFLHMPVSPGYARARLPKSRRRAWFSLERPLATSSISAKYSSISRRSVRPLLSPAERIEGRAAQSLQFRQNAEGGEDPRTVGAFFQVPGFRIALCQKRRCKIYFKLEFPVELLVELLPEGRGRYRAGRPRTRPCRPSACRHSGQPLRTASRSRASPVPLPPGPSRPVRHSARHSRYSGRR